MQKYDKLDSMSHATAAAVAVYELTRSFPESEQFGLADQLRRSAVSVGSNIAEGTGRTSDADLRRYLSIARGSATELHYQLRLAVRLGLLDEEAATPVLESVERTKATLTGHLRSLS